MNEKELKKLKSIFKNYPEIKLVYFFGSKAKGKAGPLSDYDFAFYLAPKKGELSVRLDKIDKQKMFELKFLLIDKISRLLKTDKVDVVILNLIETPELKYRIIKEGKLIFEKKPFKVFIEPQILNEYFDFHSLLLRHKLTKI